MLFYKTPDSPKIKKYGFSFAEGVLRGGIQEILNFKKKIIKNQTRLDRTQQNIAESFPQPSQNLAKPSQILGKPSQKNAIFGKTFSKTFSKFRPPSQKFSTGFCSLPVKPEQNPNKTFSKSEKVSQKNEKVF